MAKISFVNFGIEPDNQKLLQRIHETLSELYAFGDLHFRALWLYYGSLSLAAKVLDIPASTYPRLVRPEHFVTLNEILLTDDFIQKRELLEKFVRPSSISYRRGVRKYQFNHKYKWGLIVSGAQMILELPDTERKELFSKNYPLPLTRENFVRKIKSWKRENNQRPVATADRLLKHYLITWHLRNHPHILFQCGGLKPVLEKALECRKEIEAFANIFKVCFVALDIFQEYETYLFQKVEIGKHIKAQRKIINSKRKESFIVLENRDGLFCKACGSIEKLRIDHVKPLSLGGLSVLENLQLLCNFCNSSKNNRTMDYLLGVTQLSSYLIKIKNESAKNQRRRLY